MNLSESTIKRIFYCNLFIVGLYGYIRLHKYENDMICCSREEKENEDDENEEEYIDYVNPPDGCSLFPEQYCLLKITSTIPAFVSVYGYYRGYHDLATCSLGGAITSVLFWSKPDYSWRRTLDVNFIKAACLYHALRAYNSENGKIYYALNGIIFVLYPTELQFFAKKRYWLFTYSHILLHLLANTANYILYRGYVPSLQHLSL